MAAEKAAPTRTRMAELVGFSRYPLTAASPRREFVERRTRLIEGLFAPAEKPTVQKDLLTNTRRTRATTVKLISRAKQQGEAVVRSRRTCWPLKWVQSMDTIKLQCLHLVCQVRLEAAKIRSLILHRHKKRILQCIKLSNPNRFIPLNNTSRPKTNIDLPRLTTTAAPE